MKTPRGNLGGTTAGEPALRLGAMRRKTAPANRLEHRVLESSCFTQTTCGIRQTPCN
jgi:hypothetical protein